MKKILLTILIISSSLILTGCKPESAPTQEPDTAGSNSTERPPASPDTTAAESENISKYQDYTESGVQTSVAAGKTTVLFFHAGWCPTCRAAEKEILAGLDTIPDDVKIFKVDYDSETDLKNRYSIVAQHTFVVVDDDLNATAKWNGGSLKEILNNI